MDRIELRHLRPALEYAVRLAEEGQKVKPPVAYPSGLKRHFRRSRLSTGALNAVAAAVEDDEGFRRSVADAATEELVGSIGLLWLARPDGWRDEISEAVAAVERDERDGDLRAELARSEKRRLAAERAAARSASATSAMEATLEQRVEEVASVARERDRLVAEVERLSAELVEARNRIRHAGDREAAATARAETAEAEVAAARSARSAAERVRDSALADRVDEGADRSEMRRLAELATELAAGLDAFGGAGPTSSTRRRALAMPGGIVGSSSAAARFLLRSGATVLVDGYNVAKLGWPQLALAEQREVLLNHLENLVRRYGTDLTVVFDGADVAGASASVRRLVRVVFSPPERIADDVLRDEVKRLPSSRPVVVITNDAEVLRDVRGDGANILSSNQLLDEFQVAGP